MINKGIRLNKYFSEIGFCSRRAADRLIEQKRVLINDQTAVVGQKN
jgi:23S rRNA pseudouridine2604 synthase